MSDYQHILLAADFTDHGEDVANRAHDLARRYQAKLTIVHVVDNLPITDSFYGPVIPFETDITDDLMDAARDRLHELGQKLGVSKNQCCLEVGNAKYEIIRIANELAVDLIVVGSHGRHGLALLLGSTADGVLHHAQCDVMAVRLRDQ